MDIINEKSSFCNEDSAERKSNVLLNLSVQKSGDIFVADQTPTPTSLIKNCEEVGLFEDLRNVNPFDETFRRAVEHNTLQTPTDIHTGEDSLHTPQVYPLLDTTIIASEFRSCEEILQKSVDNITDVSGVEELLNEVDSYKVAAARQNSSGISHANATSIPQQQQTYGPRIENAENMAVIHDRDGLQSTLIQIPSTIQFIQPQVITLNFPYDDTTTPPTTANSDKPSITVIPVQTVRPFILPKPTEQNKQSNANLSNSVITTTTKSNTINQTAHLVATHALRSASLTPTSQLPIKERLKAILNSSTKSRMLELPVIPAKRRRSTNSRPTVYDTDSTERKRAAATRYRVKIRNEYKELRKRNVELYAENKKLHSRVLQLENELRGQQPQQIIPFPQQHQSSAASTLPVQIQIPASTLHLIMNIPKLIVPPNGQPVLQNQITCMAEKK